MAIEGRAVLLVSSILTDELAKAPPEVQQILADLPPGCLEGIRHSPEAFRLRDSYLRAGIVGPESRNDAHHVALATVAAADVMVSWNFHHIVHFDKIRGFNAVNFEEGYGPVEIRSPQEVV